MLSRATKRRLKYIEAFGGKCQQCGYHRCLRALQFHHKDAATRKDWPQENGRTSGKVSTAELEAHPEHFELLCANCHFERHHEIDSTRRIVRKCLNCGMEFLTEPHRIRSRKGKYCSKKCGNAHTMVTWRQNLPDRFARHVRKEESGCWTWMGSRINGIGAMTMKRADGTFAPTTAARISFLLKHGHYPKAKLRHTCSTSGCVNPDHLTDRKKGVSRPCRTSRPASNQDTLF